MVSGIAGGIFFFLETQKKPRIEDAKVLAIIAEGFDYQEHVGVINILKREGATVVTASFTNETVSGHGDRSFGGENDTHTHSRSFPLVRVDVLCVNEATMLADLC